MSGARHSKIATLRLGSVKIDLVLRLRNTLFISFKRKIRVFVAPFKFK